MERIKPDYMQYLLGTLHIKKILSSEENDPIKSFTVFVKDMRWKKFSEKGSEIIIFKKNKGKKIKNFTHYLKKKWENLNPEIPMENEDILYYKFDPHSIVKDSKVTLNHVIHIFYITLEAYLDAYNVQDIQETLDELNEKLNCSEAMSDEENHIPDFCSYSVTENFIKKYRSIYQTLKELMLTLQALKSSGDLPTIFKVFEKIGLLGTL